LAKGVDEVHEPSANREFQAIFTEEDIVCEGNVRFSMVFLHISLGLQHLSPMPSR
jgi:hypothetical protein